MDIAAVTEGADTRRRRWVAAVIPRTDGAVLFALFSWGHMLYETYPFFQAGVARAGTEKLFHLLAWTSYSLIYLLPVLLLIAVLRLLLGPRPIAVLAIGLTTMTLAFIHIDRTIYDLYNFHFNNFVWNLLITPGGIDSLGNDTHAYWGATAIAARLLLVQVVLFTVANRLARRFAFRYVGRTFIAILLLAMLGQQFLYGLSDLRNDGAVLDTANVYPFYMYTRFRALANSFGIPVIRRTDTASAKGDAARLNYPIEPVLYAPVERRLNIIWLVTESLRWDRMTRDIMPNTWAFGQRAQNFLNHYSSGNGTREAMFGMFYGLYGSYWEHFLHAGQAPLLMDRIMALNYQLDLRTSARFSYPEFDKTIFAKVPRNVLHEQEFSGEPWERDRDNVSALLQFMQQRDPNRPFMSFMFFESTHARYTFPPAAVIRRPYLESVNYADMSRESLSQHTDQLINRYTNAAHWVDVQLGRIYQALEQANLLDSTVVIITGDHGEEFMEKGFWGHNSSFVEEQVHTPLVVWVPGREHHEIDRMTSHMDIAVTLMQLLGASNEVGDYALGRNLFDAQPRAEIAICDWHSVSIITAELKYRIPYNNRGLNNYRPTDRNDKPFEDQQEQQMLEKYRGAILDTIRNASRFLH